MKYLLLFYILSSSLFLLPFVTGFTVRAPQQYVDGNKRIAATAAARTTTTSAAAASVILSPSRLYSSFAADGSEYSSRDNDMDSDDDETGGGFEGGSGYYRNDNNNDETPTIELQPVPLSKNAGNRFVTVVWDRDWTPEKDALTRHEDRIELTEEHVLYCRKANLYNETFNADSKVDVLWSYPILSSDLLRVIGHAMCLESTELQYIYDFLQEEPTLKMLEADTMDIPLYRWRHVRDYTLRRDDGRFGYPCMCVALLNDDDEDEDNDSAVDTRLDLQQTLMESLIWSKRVIATGPLYAPTKVKSATDRPIGDLILFNAKNRDDAVSFCEGLPTAEAGCYKDMRVYFYNQLDISGKFISEDPLRDSPCQEMKEAMAYWGYPVEDEQTPWINC